MDFPTDLSGQLRTL